MGAQMNIKSAEAIELARELAELDGVSLTQAVTRALRDAKRIRLADRSANLRALFDIIEDTHWRLDPGIGSADIDALLYDEHGLPK
jgi:antitoxin VapB